MTDRRPRVRFAPSPTGHLHVGGARTAIFNWLFARHHRGAFIVRVEDTDQARSTGQSEQMVLDDLRWLGLQWDEGPDIGGPHAPYRQSERIDKYSAVAQLLLASGLAYRCFCREEELDARRRAAEAAGRPPHYDLTCYRLDAQQISARLAGWTPFALRFHVPKEESAPFEVDVTIRDLIRGEVSWKKESLGDFILVRSDGLPTYNFSVVIDDHDMEITHVIRAEEHLTNTQRQVLLYRALGWPVPEFAHVSLILGQDRSKLSKRHGATSVSAYAEEGFLPDAMVNFLALLGWSTPDGREVFSRQYAIENFSLDRVNSAPAVFDPAKFEWFNGQYIHAMSAEELRTLIGPRLSAAGLLMEESPEVSAWLDDAIDLVRKGVHRLDAFVPALQFVFSYQPEATASDPENAAILSQPGARQLIETLLDDVRANGVPLDSEAYKALAERLKASTGLKGKELFMPMRVALTGMMHGPELVRVVPLLERGSRLQGIAPVMSPVHRLEALLPLLRG
jgi:nondiscriminating glutamyl-tRNA synthetase